MGKKKTNGSRTVLNMAMAWLAQGVTILSGLILPKLYLHYFGSETNGLIQSISQFLNYVNLLEGGLASVFLASIYKPLVDKDDVLLSKRVSAAQKYFRIIAYVFIGYSVILAIFYPLVVKSNFSKAYISSLVLILSISLFVQFFFSITYKILLQGDRKAYVILGTQIITTILSVVMIIICLRFIQSIHIAKLISAVVFLIQPIVFNAYVKKHYNIKIEKSVDAKEELPGRWSCLGQNLAFFIHSNTDVTLLTLIQGLGLKLVSVYSVHTMVVFGLKNLVMAFSQVFSPKIGLSLAGGDSDLIEEQIDQYEFVSYFISTIFFGPCICLLVPFVLLYTSKITDANYYEPVFAIILTISEYIYCIRNPYIAVVYGAGKFKETAISAYLEAGINIVLSLVLVWKFKLVGIAVGTCVAMIFRWIYHIVYLKRNVVQRKIDKPIKRFLCSSIIMCIGYFLFHFCCWFEMDTIIKWIFGGALCFFIYIMIAVVMNIIFDRSSFLKIIKRMKR